MNEETEATGPLPSQPAPGCTAVYRFYGAAGELLYVGITSDPKSRWRSHAGEKPWWHEVARKEVTWFANRTEAGIAELHAIETEGPRYDRSNPKNKIDNEDRRTQDQAYVAEALRMVRDDIEAGVFPPATALPSAHHLASRYGLSRSAVTSALWKVEPRVLTHASPHWLVLDRSSPAGEAARSCGAVYGLGIELFGLHVPFHGDDLSARSRLPKTSVTKGLGALQKTGMADMQWGKRGRALWTLLPKPMPDGLKPARDLPPHEDL
ncbi:GIY-YIG nuclease family protein [Streptomyces leeuwenhoekii]|uniref:Sle1_099 protein n=1 Tax=Streptomyces leeuwenhoekii TaxID=1437453 RepID=A0A0F7VR37_STRLW|nr:GIY-YIG nuclease family protein [Streptomyces leeuwenhoekii]CQR59266.1 sle1_099 [Streptomyces leeuwenhoekii]